VIEDVYVYSNIHIQILFTSFPATNDIPRSVTPRTSALNNFGV